MTGFARIVVVEEWSGDASCRPRAVTRLARLGTRKRTLVPVEQRRSGVDSKPFMAELGYRRFKTPTYGSLMTSTMIAVVSVETASSRPLFIILLRSLENSPAQFRLPGESPTL